MYKELFVTEVADETDYKAILDPLLSFNRAHANDPEYRALNVLLRNDEDTTIGGL